MRNLLLSLAALLLIQGCAKDSPAPASTPTKTQPVTYPFDSVSGSFLIQPSGASSYVLTNLKMQFIPKEDMSGTSITYYWTWHGITPSGSGIEVQATATGGVNVPLGNGPYNVKVATRSADAAFTTIKDIDLTGAGVITATSKGYTLPYKAQVISGALTQ